MERGKVTKSQKKEEPGRKGRWETAYHWKATGQCSKGDSVVSVMIPRLETDAIRDKKDNRPLLHQKRRHRLTGRHPQKSSSSGGESPSSTRVKIPCTFPLREKCTYPSCNFWHPPVCLNYKSESGCKYGDTCRCVEADGQPSKTSKKSV